MSVAAGLPEIHIVPGPDSVTITTTRGAETETITLKSHQYRAIVTMVEPIIARAFDQSKVQGQGKNGTGRG